MNAVISASAKADTAIPTVPSGSAPLADVWTVFVQRPQELLRDTLFTTEEEVRSH
jgi:hypothetical protein